MSSHNAAGGVAGSPRRRGSTDAYVEHGHYFVMHADGTAPIGHYWDLDKGLMIYPAYGGDTDSGVYVRTGTFYGPVAITVETYDGPEQVVPDDGDWDSRQELRIIAGGPNLRVETDGGVETDLPQLHLAPGQAAGVRLYARGVEKATDIQELTGPDDVPVEFHLLQLWRA